MNGILKGKKISHKLSYNLKSDMSEVAPIHRLAAKAKIKELEIDEGTSCVCTVENHFEWSLVSTLVRVIIQKRCDIFSISALTQIKTSKDYLIFP